MVSWGAIAYEIPLKRYLFIAQYEASRR